MHLHVPFQLVAFPPSWLEGKGDFVLVSLLEAFFVANSSP
jgi:hypothetical protein